MAEYSENVAQAAAVLGTIFYQDPASEKGKTAFSWLAANGADAWEFGQPAAGEALELIVFLRRRGHLFTPTPRA